MTPDLGARMVVFERSSRAWTRNASARLTGFLRRVPPRLGHLEAGLGVLEVAGRAEALGAHLALAIELALGLLEVGGGEPRLGTGGAERGLRLLLTWAA